MKVLSAVVFVILLAGARATTPTVVNVDAGDFYAFTILALGQEIESCILQSPAGSPMVFTHGAPSAYSARYELQPINAFPACSVLVRDLQMTDAGLWEISFVSTTGTRNSITFQLNVTSIEPETPRLEDEAGESTDDSVNENVDIEWSNIIKYPTRTNEIIDITLPQIGHEEECSIRTPKGAFLKASEMNLESVKVHKSSNFVSCSITVGPMVEDLLGNWTICGKYAENHKEHERCQLASIYWNRKNSPEISWHTDVQPKYNHPVHYGLTMHPVVKGIGDVVTCHIVTPEGEDLALNQNSKYPSIEITLADSSCSFAIGPIHDGLLGDWTIYGLFENSVEGLHEVRLQFHMYIYDEENPYNQAYNSTIRDPVIRTVNLGNTLNEEVGISAGRVDSCYIETPAGVFHTMGLETHTEGVAFIKGEDGSVKCKVAIGPITERHLGDWKITGKFNNNGIFTELQQTFRLIEEDPENPIIEDRTISFLATQAVKTEMGHSHQFVIPSHDFIYGESCHIRTPDGLQYQLTKGFDIVAGIEILEENGIECGVKVTAVSKKVVGEWTLIARAKHHSEPIERRLPFTIDVEDDSENTTGLENPTKPEISSTTLTLLRDRSVSTIVGPEDAVYCRLEDPQGVAVFDNFGRCLLKLSKVGLEHHGIWKVLVATPAKMLAEEHELTVSVVESEGKPVVSTYVAQAKPIVDIACSVHPAAEVVGCKFRDPQGRILLAAAGLAEGRYQFYGSGLSSESGVLSHECGIRITEPVTSDLGLWRCALQTAEETYYGHLPVLYPEALSVPAVAAVVQQEPILKSSLSALSVVEEDPAVLSCSVEANIRYCYFRAANGTTFAVTPGVLSSTMEYVGAGFDAGECSVRLHGLHASDSGLWSCHVGLIGMSDEQTDQFQLTVHERMRVSQYTSHGTVMTVEGIVYENRALEYCRFVRIDGFGFTSDSMPAQYTLTGTLSNGQCQFTVQKPTMLDLHPWTIAARIRGQDAEIIRDTMESILIGESTTPRPQDSHPDQVIIYRYNGLGLSMYLFLSLMLVIIVLGGIFGPKKNREWTSQRASSFRRSFSNSFRKQQPQNNQATPPPHYTP